MEHVPVLLQEVLQYLEPSANEDVIDATVNGGGHAEALLARIAPRGRLLGIDRDPTILVHTRQRLAAFGDRVILAEGTFACIATLAEDAGVLHPHRVLFDLGFSSYHLASAHRGFSFQGSEPLDMRYDSKQSLTAGHLVNHAPAEELEQLFREYGEERKARLIASAIAKERKRKRFETTAELRKLIERFSGPGRIHPATRVFQALRIAVNDELAHVRAGIKDAFRILAPKGRLAVISFHSLEDRIIKHAFKDFLHEGRLITKKPVTAGSVEIRQNPRARSAKLRVIEKNIPLS